MSSSPSIFSGDSDHQNGSDILGYASRTDPGAGFLAGVNMSPVFNSPDFSRRPQDTGAMHSSVSMVRLLAMLRVEDTSDFFEAIRPIPDRITFPSLRRFLSVLP
jgi:hypothetical protein